MPMRRGERYIEDAKRGAWFGRVNVIGALCGGAHFAIECFKQPAGSMFFEAWVENGLIKAIPKGYTVIMDNAGFHRKSILRKIVRGKARLLFLPPYSPITIQ
jgi:hypothetical protein